VILIVLMVISANRKTRSRDPLSGLKPGVYQATNSGETLPVPAPRR
jgi:hypothetical protein